MDRSTSWEPHGATPIALTLLLLLPLAGALPLPLLGPSGGEETTTQAETDADLSLTKVDSEDPVAVGSSFTYNLTIANAGPARANDVVVTDTLPAGVSFASAAGATCSASGAVVTCTRNNLNSGSSFTIRINVTASTVGNWTNTASVTAVETDPDASDNADSEQTTIRTAAPTGLACLADEQGVHLDWNDTSQATGYNVYRATGETGEFVLLASSATSDHLDGTAAVGQTYRYRVTSVSTTGESAPSESCTIASVPEFPSLLAGALALAGSACAYARLRRR